MHVWQDGSHGEQAPPPRYLFEAHEAQSVAPGPVHVAHEASHAEHTVLAVVVQAETWNIPGWQDVHADFWPMAIVALVTLPVAAWLFRNRLA